MNQKYPSETIAEALRLVDSGMSVRQVATKLDIPHWNISNWTYLRKKRNAPPGVGKTPGRGYVPVVRAGMNYIDLLCPEARAEFRRRQDAKAFEVFEGEW